MLLHGLSRRKSVTSVRSFVRLSVCRTDGLCTSGSTYEHDFFTVWQPNDSSFVAPIFGSTIKWNEREMHSQIQVR